jgi:dienelactone hydrolase
MWTGIVPLDRFLRGEQTRPPTLLSRAALLLPVVGAVGSVGLMLRAGPRDESPILFALFAIWVLSPFVALGLATVVAGRCSALTRATIHVVMLILTAGSLAIYGSAASAPPGSGLAFPFLVVPVGSWLLVSTAIPMAALASGRLSRLRRIGWLIRAIVVVGLLGVLGIAILLGLLLLDHNSETTLPTPTGPSPIGRTTYVWSDAQADPLAAQPGTTRELLAWVWYPAAPRQPGQTGDEYLPAPWRTALEGQRGVLLTQFLTRDLSRVRTHSILDAEVSPQRRSYPVVLMRAGLAALTTDYTSLAEDLASHGYVVVGFDAPYRSFVVVFPDGRVIARAPQNNADLVSGAQQEQLANKLVRAWSADLSFALDQLERLNASDPSGRFLGRLDLRRVGAFGHSLGGATALQFCHDDSRCKAGIDVDGAPLDSVIAEGVTQPFMFVLSDHRGESDDAEAPEAIRQAKANIRSVYDRLPVDGRLEIEIRGANHFLFCDGAMLRSPPAMRVMRALGITDLDGRRQVAVTAHCISTFFNVYLKGAPASELQNLSAYPEIELIP